MIIGSSLPQFVSVKVTKEKATTFKILKIDFFIFSLIWLLILYKEIDLLLNFLYLNINSMLGLCNNLTVLLRNY